MFLCGGATPFYYEALCSELTWLEYIRGRSLPLAGTSAGATLLARYALVGGWQAERGSTLRPMLFQGASEGLDALAVGPGLGLVEGAGEITRLPYTGPRRTHLRLRRARRLALPGEALLQAERYCAEGQRRDAQARAPEAAIVHTVVSAPDSARGAPRPRALQVHNLPRP